MLFLLIFPVLVAGFFACHIHPVHFYRLHRYEGQYLYLKSAELGLKCFAIATCAALAAHYWLPDAVLLCQFQLNLAVSSVVANAMQVLGARDSEAIKMAWFFQLSALTFLSAFVIKGWGHLRLYVRFYTWNTKVYVIGELLEDSPLEILLFRLSLEKTSLVMLTMDDRKVYVGKVISMGEPSETSGMDQDISIMPLMSGYRNKDDLGVKFTTYYGEAEDDADISLSIRQGSITSATEFSFSAYKKFNPVKSLLVT